MAKKKPVRKSKKRPAAKKAAPVKAKKKKTAPKTAAPKRKAPPKAKKTVRATRKPSVRPKPVVVRAAAAAAAPAAAPAPSTAPPTGLAPSIHIRSPLAGATVSPSFPASGTAFGVNSVQGTMTSLTTGNSFQGTVGQPPPNWLIGFTNLPAPDDYSLTVNDPTTGASDTQQPIHVRALPAAPSPV